MTVRELIDDLKQFAPDAVVLIDLGDNVVEIDSITPSEDAPDDEIYIEVNV